MVQSDQEALRVFAELYRDRFALATETATLRSENARLQQILSKPDPKDRVTRSTS